VANWFISGKWHYYEQLPQHEKPVYITIHNGLKNHKTDFAFRALRGTEGFPSRERLAEIFNFVLWDHPSLYYVDGINAAIGYQDAAVGIVRVWYEEYYDEAQRAQIESLLWNMANRLIKQIWDDDGPFFRLDNLYWHMVENVRYLNDAVQDRTQKNLEARTIVGALLNHTAVYSGYAKLFKLICDQIGIECLYVDGKLRVINGWARYGWNAVKLKMLNSAERVFYHVDAATDNLLHRRDGKVEHGHFLLGDASMLKDHTWDRGRVPPMQQDYVS